jgi:hypothetical protein
MDAFKKLLPLVGATLVALLLVAGPALAVDDPGGDEAEMPVEGEDEEVVGDHGDAEGGKIELFATPRDQVGMILLTALVVGGGLAFANARRQYKGERPAATGEFRWR